MEIAEIQKLLPGVVLLGLLWLVYGVISRLYLSPLAKFPSPKLVALSKWYEFYCEVVLNGKFTFEIRRVHEKYGAASYLLQTDHADTGQVPLSGLPQMSFTSTILTSRIRFMPSIQSRKSIAG
jgi:hypothetical protein